ncbi:hypothetical protein JW960_03830 [candidate division KSB1 bacterium]|nr:hypothetical protein [candidate division KSB1 bacterium]
MTAYSRYLIIIVMVLLTVFNGFNTNLLIAQQPILIHFPVETGFVGESIPIEAHFEQSTIQVIYARLYYRVQGSQAFQHVDMQEQADGYAAEIPAREVKEPAMEYFVAAVLRTEEMVTSPAHNPYYNPYEITILKRQHEPAVAKPEVTPEKVPEAAPPKKQMRIIPTSQISFMILNPDPNSTIEADDAFIVISTLIEKGDIDKSSIRLTFDGKDVTPQIVVTDYMMTYVPENISAGRHRVNVQANDTTGTELKPLQWSFWVNREGEFTQAPKKSIPIDGRFFTDIKNENVSDSTRTTLTTGLDFNGEYKSIQYRGHMFITSREDQEYQPRNRFLLDVGTSRIGVRLGDMYPRFNDLILWGKRVRGINAYLKFGFFNLEYVHGETNRAIQGKPYALLVNITGDTVKNAFGQPLWLHPTTGDTVQSTDGIYRYGTYKQNLMGVRPSFGSGDRFQLGLNYIKVKDDLNSIQYGINPKDNIVVGPDIYIALCDKQIELDAGMALSLITNDISEGVVTKAEIDSSFDTDIPFDPTDYEKYIIINTSTTPIDPMKKTSLAYNVNFKWRVSNNTFRIRYKSIGSEYLSLGNTFLRKDIAGFSFSDRIQVYRNQVYVTLGLDNFVDGINEKDDGNPATEPIDLMMFNVGISYFPRNKMLPRINLNIKDHNRDNGLSTGAEANPVQNKTQDISLQIGYDFRLYEMDHTVNFSLIGSDRIDEFNPATANINNNNKLFSLQTRYIIPLTTTFTFARNQSSTGQGIANEYTFDYTLVSFHASYFLLNRKLKLTGGLNNTSAVGSRPSVVIDPVTSNPVFVNDEYTNFKRLAFEAGTSYQISQNQYVILDTRFIQFDDQVTRSYNDSIIRLRYEYKY